MSEEEKAIVKKLAHQSAKEHFRKAGIPHWTTSYQIMYPFYVRNYIRVYEKKITEQRNG